MNHRPHICERYCKCRKTDHTPARVVVTGGPGAGKTAVLEMARKHFCRHVAVLPEAASIVFSGGFWRLATAPAQMAAQRAIFHVQHEMEELIAADGRWALALCDRGTLDGLAYWPATEESYWSQLSSTSEHELKRYQAVIHLRTPTEEMGYNHQNELRIETAEQARAIDERIVTIWSRHPRYSQISSTGDFLQKAKIAITAIEEWIPACCRIPA